MSALFHASRPLERLQQRSFPGFPLADVSDTVGHRFAVMVRAFGDRPAVVEGDLAVTYRELDEMANRLAAELMSDDETAGAIGLLTELSIPRIVGMLAALKLGRAYVPLDSKFPARRIHAALNHASCSDVVAQGLAGRESLLASFLGKVHVVEPTFAGSTVAPEASVKADSPSHLLYTSGSSGRPKAILQSHRMVLHNIYKYTNGFRIGPDDRVSQVFSPAFGESVNDIFMALLNGAALHVREFRRHGLGRLAEWINGREISILHCVPTLLRSFLTRLPEGPNCRGLRIVNLGGEPVSNTDLQACFERLNPDGLVVNSYGATETKLIAQHYVDRESLAQLTHETVPVGRPMPNTRVRVIDEQGYSVPAGEVGEIEVRSRYIARGYWQGTPAEQTKFSIPDDPAAEVVFRTGDAGRMSNQGVLEHLGRCDGMIKLRGYRIEPSEIEVALQDHPDVQQAVVFVDTHSEGAGRLVAIFVPVEGRQPSIDDLRMFLRIRMPEYMVPVAFIAVSRFPVNDNGKTDGAALKKAFAKNQLE
jgi:amino acid adenylation domain-containing protein